MTYLLYLIAFTALAASVAAYVCLRHYSRFQCGIDDPVTCDDPTTVTIQVPVIHRVREMETPAAQYARRMEAMAADEQRSPFPDEVDRVLINYETMGA